MNEISRRLVVGKLSVDSLKAAGVARLSESELSVRECKRVYVTVGSAVIQLLYATSCNCNQ